MRVVLPNVCLGICSAGNTSALLICLSAVLNGTHLPGIIRLRLEGKLPDFDFYLEQLASLAVIKGVKFEIHRKRAEGIRVAREWMLTMCETNALWMLDDDVMPIPSCLADLSMGFASAVVPEKLIYVAGLKVDVNNRRNYSDFSLEERDGKGELSQNHLYKSSVSAIIEHYRLDTGNVLIQATNARAHNLSFLALGDSPSNAGGEDELFGQQVNEKGLFGVMCTDALAWHLEKPQVNFTPQRDRAEVVRLGTELLKSKSHDHSNNPQLEAAGECTENSS